ncbi:hypothetical protein BDV12DRAFT_187020 [Aspergillus spectabilis]
MGAACAHQLAQHGTHPTLTNSTNLEAMNALVADLRSQYAEDHLILSIHEVDGVVEHIKSQKRGWTMFMSSIAAYGGGIYGCHYAASKGGPTGMMKYLSTRLAKYNITVNDVAPAMIGDTGVVLSTTAIAGVRSIIPLFRLGTPEETANVVTMLKTGYMTGQSLLLAGWLK